MTQTINFHIPDEIRDAAKKYATEKGYTLSTLCRVALLEKINQASQINNSSAKEQ